MLVEASKFHSKHVQHEHGELISHASREEVFHGNREHESLIFCNYGQLAGCFLLLI